MHAAGQNGFGDPTAAQLRTLRVMKHSIRHANVATAAGGNETRVPGRQCSGVPDTAPPSTPSPVSYPRWLLRELRSDHAGEAGAVAIYQGILATAGDPGVRDFARRHLETERRHLRVIESLLAPELRSRLVGASRLAGFALGAGVAALGPRPVYVTIDAVETFVDRHYRAQLERLAHYPEFAGLAELLAACRADELAHRDEARDRHRNSRLAQAWAWLVDLGSRGAVVLVMRF